MAAIPTLKSSDYEFMITEVFLSETVALGMKIDPPLATGDWEMVTTHRSAKAFSVVWARKKEWRT